MFEAAQLSFIVDMVARILALLFGLAALLHLAPPAALRAGYQSWGYAPSFVRVLGAVLALTAIFLLISPLRVWGGVLGATLLFTNITALLHRERYLCAVLCMLPLGALPLAALAPVMA